MNKLIDEGRMGRFHISRMILRNTDEKTLLSFFANFIIVRAESMFSSDTVEYIAYSRLFDVTDEGETAPMYTIGCRAEVGQVVEIFVKRLENE